MIFVLLIPPQGWGQTVLTVARPVYVSISHTKFGWISSNGLGGDSITDGRKKRGDNKSRLSISVTTIGLTKSRQGSAISS